MSIETGIENGKRWLAGEVKVKTGVICEIDTRTGKGFDKVLEAMSSEIEWHSNRSTLPGYTIEDVAHELVVLILEAVPHYNAAKGTVLTTFLQNHLRNRIINLYKRFTQKSKTATHDNFWIYRAVCSKCGAGDMFDVVHDQVPEECGTCGFKEDVVRKAYPVNMVLASTNQQGSVAAQTIRIGNPDFGVEGQSVEDTACYEDLAKIKMGQSWPTVESQDANIWFKSIVEDAQIKDRLILKQLEGGWSLHEIAERTGLTVVAVQERIANLFPGA